MDGKGTSFTRAASGGTSVRALAPVVGFLTMMRKAIIVLVVIAAGFSVWLVRRDRAHHFIVRAYFHNAQGLKRDAGVRANGLEVVKVKDVGLRAGLGDQPVEVLMRLDSRYGAWIPNDSVAAIATEGLLGPPYVEIDVSKASGSPIANNGTLKSVELPDGRHILESFLNAINEKLAIDSDKLKELERKNIPTRQPRNSDRYD
jgi:ABC-type transporter Mla subunit MlaD